MVGAGAPRGPGSGTGGLGHGPGGRDPLQGRLAHARRHWWLPVGGVTGRTRARYRRCHAGVGRHHHRHRRPEAPRAAPPPVPARTCRQRGVAGRLTVGSAGGPGLRRPPAPQAAGQPSPGQAHRSTRRGPARPARGRDNPRPLAPAGTDLPLSPRHRRTRPQRRGHPRQCLRTGRDRPLPEQLLPGAHRRRGRRGGRRGGRHQRTPAAPRACSPPTSTPWYTPSPPPSSSGTPTPPGTRRGWRT